MGCPDLYGALLRAGASEASGGFGHVGHGGHDGGIGSERRSVGSFVRGPQADVCLASERWPVGSHGCDPGMKRDLAICEGGPGLYMYLAGLECEPSFSMMGCDVRVIKGTSKRVRFDPPVA